MNYSAKILLYGSIHFEGVKVMNAPIAWLDGLLCIVIFVVLFSLLAWLFRHDGKQSPEQS